jgi:uncharacterized protein
MSTTVDANILVYASNESDPVHAEARALVDRLAAGPDLVYFFWPVLLGYLRIVTHSTILPSPLGPVDAMQNIGGLLALPHVRAPGEHDGFWNLFEDTARSSARGNTVPDAHVATLMRQHGVRTIYTRDRDYRRFDGIQAIDPFQK